ncbi:methyltransferase domain-containing protein [Acidaminobacter sp.]|uniref:methyltransferase domain-containing protein n=1 Tax=Acidaminobacter sp. TaxID=1872102 RepID=UPI002561F2C5|nr:methyltransferase domain-containing protein [Acidaminobacter sp.]MDK9711858.1 methyltransferase domain-containing protein [Acidaminobacter sp.]
MSVVWDFWSNFYERLWVQKVSLGPTRRAVAAKLAGRLRADSRVLDVGCGIGELLGELALEAGVAQKTSAAADGREATIGQFTGIDASPGMIAKARRRHPELTFEVRDASALRGLVLNAHEREKFDVVLCTHSLPYYADPAKVLADMAAIMAPDGVLVLAQASANSTYDAAVLSLVKLTTGTASYYSVDALKQMAAGFFVVESVEKVKTAWFMPSIILMVLRLKAGEAPNLGNIPGNALAPNQIECLTPNSNECLTPKSNQGQTPNITTNLYREYGRDFKSTNPLKILLLRVMPDPETIGLQHVMVCEPLELEYLAANLGADGHDTLVVDMILEHRPLEAFLKEFQPEVVLMSGYITHVGTLKDTARAIKAWNPETLIGVGGVHAEVVPEDFLTEQSETPVFDRVFTKKKKLGVRHPVSSLDAVQEARVWLGAAQETAASQGLLPPDRSSTARYRDKYYYMFHNPCALIKTSYGCPYDCSFCFCREITGGVYSERPIRDVIEELKTIPEEEVYIVDDDFLVSAERVKNFCDELDAANLNKKFLIYGRADFVARNEHIIERFKKSGLRAVIIGLESVRAQDLTTYSKRTSLEENEKAAAILRRHGVELYGTLILGMDFDKEDFNTLNRWLKANRVHFVNLQPLTPLPGTAIFDDYKDQLLVPREDYPKWDLAHLVLKPQKLSVRGFYWEMLKLYHKRVASPAHVVELIRRYGLMPVIRLSTGSARVSLQYLKKIRQG